MLRSVAFTTVVGALTLIPRLAPAQAAPPDSARVEAARRVLQSDLRNFLTAQERYYADHRTYAGSLREMASIYAPSRGATLILLTSSDGGHSEVAIYEGIPGLVCATFAGSAQPPLGKGREGEPVCNGP
ncbi:MAG TPA: hypothetical protein VGA22_06855 [Gemmatimonadales bacterium]|jgi:hypothetical protein